MCLLLYETREFELYSGSTKHAMYKKILPLMLSCLLNYHLLSCSMPNTLSMVLKIHFLFKEVHGELKWPDFFVIKHYHQPSFCFLSFASQEGLIQSLSNQERLSNFTDPLFLGCFVMYLALLNGELLLF